MGAVIYIYKTLLSITILTPEIQIPDCNIRCASGFSLSLDQRMFCYPKPEM